MTVLLVLIILVVLIVGHELGHFIAAKITGVKVEEFGVGYPPRAFSFGRWGGTEYTLNWIPFGGFVRLWGDEGESQRGAGAFASASRIRQALILIAGVAMNFIIAWGLFAYAYTLGVPRAVFSPGPGIHLIVSEVVPGSPASSAGLASGDQILSVSDTGASVDILTPEKVVAFVRARAGKEVRVSYVHNGTTTEAVMRPAHAVIADNGAQPAIGIGLVLVSDSALSIPQAILTGFTRTSDECIAVAGRLWGMIRGSFAGHTNIKEVVGPIGLVGVVGEAATHGWGYVLGLAAIISANLAIINLIPIPALDGGRLALLGLEAIFRRPMPRGFVSLINAAGIAILVILMIAVTYNDILRLFA